MKDIFFILTATLLFLVYLIMMILADRHDYNYKADCRAAGGVPVITSKGNLCINPSSIIKLNRG